MVVCDGIVGFFGDSVFDLCFIVGGLFKVLNDKSVLF